MCVSLSRAQFVLLTPGPTFAGCGLLIVIRCWISVLAFGFRTVFQIPFLPASATLCSGSWESRSSTASSFAESSFLFLLF